jgi:hypothetical protein
MSSESERPTLAELEGEELKQAREEQMDKLFLDFCLTQELHPESTEAAVRFEGWYAERTDGPDEPCDTPI